MIKKDQAEANCLICENQGGQNGILDFYACDGSFVSGYHDRDGESIHEICTEGDQLCFWYRTGMSMKNKDTWEFAHKYIGKVWFWLGWILVPVTVIPMLFVVGRPEDVVGAVGGIVCVVELVVLIFAIVPTERALKKTFDKAGNRKTE